MVAVDEVVVHAAAVVIVGGNGATVVNDRIVDSSHTRRIAENIPGAHVVTLPNAGHQITYTHANEVAAAIRRAIGRRPAPTR